MRRERRLDLLDDQPRKAGSGHHHQILASEQVQAAAVPAASAPRPTAGVASCREGRLAGPARSRRAGDRGLAPASQCRTRPRHPSDRVLSPLPDRPGQPVSCDVFQASTWVSPDSPRHRLVRPHRQRLPPGWFLVLGGSRKARDHPQPVSPASHLRTRPDSTLPTTRNRRGPAKPGFGCGSGLTDQRADST